MVIGAREKITAGFAGGVGAVGGIGSGFREGGVLGLQGAKDFIGGNVEEAKARMGASMVAGGFQ